MEGGLMGCQWLPGPAKNTGLGCNLSDTCAPPNTGIVVTGAGAVAEKSQQHKILKYSHLHSPYMYVVILVAVETSGVFGSQSLKFIKNLGWRLEMATDEDNSMQYFL